MRERYVPFVRQFTGKAVSRAYVLDRKTGQMVAACPHQHRQRRHQEYDASGVRRVTGGVAYAERCAKRLLRDFLAANQ